jgi:dihydroxy-acid dehydratase
MACILEAMGLALPFSATAPATHAERLRIAEMSGQRAAEIALSGSPHPDEIITASSIRNAMVVLHAIGGSTNGLLHLIAIAGRAGIPFDLEAFDRLGHDVPVLIDLKPTGKHYMEDFHYAGGMPTLLRELAPLLDLDTRTVSGKTLGELISNVEAVPKQDVIRSLSSPLQDQGALAVLGGNLAPKSALIKQSAATPALMKHTGRAIVFDSLEDLANRIDSPDLDVLSDDVLVLRNAGPKGAPGMPEAGYIPIPSKLARQGVKDMVRISDARMSGTAFGTIILHIAPEAAVGGPLAVVRTGDRISLDVAARRIDLLVSDQELQSRLDEWHKSAPARAPARGYARLYHDAVLQADLGCDFDFLLYQPDPKQR